MVLLEDNYKLLSHCMPPTLEIDQVISGTESMEVYQLSSSMWGGGPIIENLTLSLPQLGINK